MLACHGRCGCSLASCSVQRFDAAANPLENQLQTRGVPVLTCEYQRREALFGCQVDISFVLEQQPDAIRGAIHAAVVERRVTVDLL
eukprot:2488616-Prymnesium_polylepis.1